MSTKSVLLGLIASCALAPLAEAQAVGYREHPSDPWAPMYFRTITPNDSEWIPLFAIRLTACIPPDFLLANIMDTTPGTPPFPLRAFSCPLVVSGHSVYTEESDPDRMRAPILTYFEGKNSVVVYLVPNASFFSSPGRPAPLTYKMLLEMPGKLVGIATEYSETFSPFGGAGGGGAKQPWAEIRAKGKLLDGRTFRYYAKLITTPDKPEVGHVANYELVLE